MKHLAKSFIIAAAVTMFAQAAMAAQSPPAKGCVCKNKTGKTNTLVCTSKAHGVSIKVQAKGKASSSVLRAFAIKKNHPVTECMLNMGTNFNCIQKVKKLSVKCNKAKPKTIHKGGKGYKCSPRSGKTKVSIRCN